MTTASKPKLSLVRGGGSSLPPILRDFSERAVYRHPFSPDGWAEFTIVDSRPSASYALRTLAIRRRSEGGVMWRPTTCTFWKCCSAESGSAVIQLLLNF